jgi:tetratricopeptide (TPR) repeat protein
MGPRLAAGLRGILRNGFTLLALTLVVLIEIARLVSRYSGSKLGLIVFGVLAGALLVYLIGAWRAHRRFGKYVTAAGNALDADQHREALQTCDEAIALARKWRFTPDDLVAMVFVIRSVAMQKSGDNQEALNAAARAFTCLCRVKRAGTQLAVFDQLGTLLLQTGHERRAIPILEAAVGLGHRAEGEPLRTAARLERAAMASMRVGVHANAAVGFGRAVDLVTKEKGPDAVELVNPYINLGNSYKRMQKLEDAERCYREALRLYQANKVENPEQLSIILLNIGVACAETGRDPEAEKYYHQVLELRIQTLGRNHWRVGNTYNNLSNCRRRMRDFAGAEEYIQQAIAILEVRPESLCNAVESLSRLREDQGKIEEALAATTRAREIQQSLTTPDFSEMATLFEREALLADRCGDEQRAKDCRSRASEARQTLACAPPADRDLTNLPESLKALEQHLAASLERVKALEQTV